MRKPIFIFDINRLGEWYYVEIQGYDTLALMQSGDFAFVERKIMGWPEETLGEIMLRQRRENAPCWRFWKASEGKPTAADRRAHGWNCTCRVWRPSIEDMQNRSRYLEYTRTGRTRWED